jgi:tetratricopeptide (TPR) repeat protein
VNARLSSLYDAGTLALHEGRLEEAHTLLSLVAARTQDASLAAQAWGNLGVGLRRQGRQDEARQAFEAALQHDPARTSAHFNLANTLRSMGALDEALAHYKALAKAHPERADVVNNMGAVLMAMGRAEEAEDCFSEAIRLCPQDAHIWGNLAAAQAAAGRTLAPLRSLQQALKCNPRSAHLLLILGHHLVEQGHLHAAVRAFRAAARLEPDKVATVVGLATVLHRLGEDAEAETLLLPLVQSDQASPNLVAIWTQICRRMGRPQAAIGPLQDQLDQVQAPATQVLLQHNLGDVLDQTGQHDAAFAAYSKANALRGLKHDPDAHSAWVDRLIAQPPGPAIASIADPTPVFIVGMPRSGTSLVEQILASHPDCHGAGELGELHQLSRLAARRESTPFPEVLRELDQSTLDQLAGAYLKRLKRGSQGAARVTDKMPDNFLVLGLAAAVTPGARVIHCVRDPADTGLSCFFQNFKDTLAFTTRLDWLARWMTDYHRLMDHWQSSLSLPILRVPYEALCQDPGHWSRMIVDFIGLSWDPSCLQPHTHPRVVRTASYAQVREPTYQTSIGRSSAYERHIPDLIALRRSRSTQVSSIEPQLHPKMLGTGG